jgi:hypothetical protein
MKLEKALTARLLATLLSTTAASAFAAPVALTLPDQVLVTASDITCNHLGDEFWVNGVDKTVESGLISLGAGAYKPDINGLNFRFSKHKEWRNLEDSWGGNFTLEVIRVQIFGAEDVISSYARTYSNVGLTEGRGNEEFNSFTVSAGEVSSNVQYKLRITLHSMACSRTAVRDIKVDLPKI